MVQTRKRYQKGSLRRVGKQWIAQWREKGQRRKARWSASELNKTQAEQRLADILAPINRGASTPVKPTFGEFVEQTYLPFYRGKWKRSTAMTNEHRLKLYLTSVYGPRSLESFSRDELQEFLKSKAARLSHSIVAH